MCWSGGFITLKEWFWPVGPMEFLGRLNNDLELMA